MPDGSNGTYTRRQFLLMRALGRGMDWDQARAYVAGVFADTQWTLNPDEVRTYDEWVSEERGGCDAARERRSREVPDHVS